MGLEPALQILTRARQQEVGREGLSIFLKCHDIVVLGRALAVIDHGEGVGRVAERRMGRDVINQLAADIDATAVADALEIVLAGHQHDWTRYTGRPARPAGGRGRTCASAGAQASFNVAPACNLSATPPTMRARKGNPWVLPITRSESP